MFTGIIEDIGIIVTRASDVLIIRTALDDIGIGDSIAVNGVCLTATAIEPAAGSFLVSCDYSPETASRTTLVTISQSDRVNLERALTAGGRMGGHILTGHVEDTGTLVSAITRGNSMILMFSAQENIMRYIVPKCSIGIDGISLTVADCANGRFSIAVIPHTMAKTSFANIKPGSAVNIEPDILAKYVEHFLVQRTVPQGNITEKLLKENGFF